MRQPRATGRTGAAATEQGAQLRGYAARFSLPSGPDATKASAPLGPLPADLATLEADSIAIFRDSAALFERPVMLYSIGKDSSVLLHLALKAFWPEPPPFPIVHIDTTWKFAEMIALRDALASALNLNLVVHTNADGLAAGVNPFTSGSAEHTRVMKTVALHQILAKLEVDAAIGGARRDEERVRAKERVFSVRRQGQSWDPRDQRPEFWDLVNPRLAAGQSMRVFPLSDWTERDVWRYIRQENIPVAPLYFAAPRPVVERAGQLLVVDDDRFALAPGEAPALRQVRFRTLGCYPLTGAVESTAETLDDVIAELETARLTERAGRLIDADQDHAMERKKREGYF